jgi:hypothetical protein
VIICPECKKPNDIISERPSWLFTETPFEELIEVQSHCCNCKINFNTKHKLGRVLKVFDIEMDKEYPFSA